LKKGAYGKNDLMGNSRKSSIRERRREIKRNRLTKERRRKRKGEGLGPDIRHIKGKKSHSSREGRGETSASPNWRKGGGYSAGGKYTKILPREVSEKKREVKRSRPREESGWRGKEKGLSPAE